jgi:predicted RNA-binding protein with PIN domain
VSDEEGAEQMDPDQPALDRPPSGESKASRASLQHRHLRSAIEFAVVAARRFPADQVPDAVRRQTGQRQVAGSSLGPLRRAIDADPTFRNLVADALLEQLELLDGADETPVDALGSLWLLRPTGWSDAVATLLEIERQRAEIEALQADLRREQRRRAGAEGHLARERGERERWQRLHSTQSEQIEALGAQVQDSVAAVAALRAEMAELRTAARHATDREVAAQRRAEQLQSQLDEVRRGDERPAGPDAAAIQAGSSETGSSETVTNDRVVVDPETLADTAAQLDSLADRVRGLLGSSPSNPTGTRSSDRVRDSLDGSDPAGIATRRSGRTANEAGQPSRRRALTMPAGVLSESRRGSEYLLSSSSVVIVDGYNVTKTNWSHLDLEVQRERLIDELETLANRRRNEVVVVFDGTEQFGTATRRRRGVRVVFSPMGVLADDVIRREVADLDAERSITVVTNDRAIRNDVARCGANLMRSEALLEVLGV